MDISESQVVCQFQFLSLIQSQTNNEPSKFRIKIKRSSGLIIFLCCDRARVARKYRNENKLVEKPKGGKRKDHKTKLQKIQKGINNKIVQTNFENNESTQRERERGDQLKKINTKRILDRIKITKHAI